MRVVFRKGVDEAWVRDTVSGLPFLELLGKRVLLRVELDDASALVKLTFRSDELDSEDPDGGFRLNVQPASSEALGPTLEVARHNDGRLADDIPVITEKQTLRKLQRRLEALDEYDSSRIRAFGSGSF